LEVINDPGNDFNEFITGVEGREGLELAKK
jgi:hypothetical protein